MMFSNWLVLIPAMVGIIALIVTLFIFLKIFKKLDNAVEAIARVEERTHRLLNDFDYRVCKEHREHETRHRIMGSYLSDLKDELDHVKEVIYTVADTTMAQNSAIEQLLHDEVAYLETENIALATECFDQTVDGLNITININMDEDDAKERS